MLLQKDNSPARGANNSAPIILDGMAKSRRHLTIEEKADAARLQAIWLRQQRILGLTQEQVAAECGWTTQGAFNQYLRGRIPLNVRAVLRLAKALQVDAADISPRLAADLPHAPRTVREESARYLSGIAKKQESEENRQRAIWLQLYEDLQREDMADAGLRLIKHLASELRRKKRTTRTPKDSRKRKTA